MSLLSSRDTFKPIFYPQAMEFWRRQQRVHWIGDEVDLNGDIKDWNHNLTSGERNLLTQLFRFFVQGDVDVADGYLRKYIPALGGHPEIAMMLTVFANAETIHVDAYDKMLATIGMPDVEYQAFRSYAEMAAKHDYVSQFNPAAMDNHDDYVRELIRTLAVYSGFTEGLQLFSSFAILMNFSRFGKMLGMNKMVEWSVRDESLHCEGMCWLTRTLVAENMHLWTDDLRRQIYDIARKMVELEDSFIDLCFREAGYIEGLTTEQLKVYIRYIADRRLMQLGLKPNYHETQNPLDWMDWMLGDSQTNFFEGKETEYAKGALVLNWDEAFA